MTESEARTTAILDSALFEAWMQPTKAMTPSPRARFRWRTHPSNLWLLETQAARTKIGNIWQSGRFGLVGWNIDHAEALKTLAAALVGRPELADHPRLPVLRAWQAFVWRLPAFVRAEEHARSKRYRAADHLAEREMLLAEFARANRKHPPKPLPKNFSLEALTSPSPSAKVVA